MTKCDIPTAMTEAETKALQAVAAGKHVIEIGALLGYSTVKLAEVATRVVSIDPHVGYPESDPRPTWNEYQRNLTKHGVRHKVVPVCATWQAAFNTLPEEVLFPYHVVFIDLTGKYEDTVECLSYFHPEFGWALKTIAVHDCGHKEYPGVAEAIEDFKKILGMHTTFEQVDSLGILRYA